MSTITREQAQKIIEAADEVITALAGTNEDVHPESDNMIRLWDDLNDKYAPPEVVRELARIALAAPVIPEKRSPRDMELLLDETGAEVSDQDLDLVLTLMSTTWNLCRNAMLQGGKS